jgi:hypothetical protein
MSIPQRFVISADRATWAERMEAGCSVIEKHFGIQLSQAHGGTKNNATATDIASRERFWRDRLKTKTRWFSIFSGHGLSRVGNTFVNRSYYNFGGTMYGSGSAYVLSFVCPEQSPAQHEALLVTLGDALGAHHSEFTPPSVAWRLRLIHHRSPLGGAASAVETVSDVTPEERRLPPIRESLYEGLTELQPHNFGWINYWSQEVAAYVGFPESAVGTMMAEHSYRTPAGAWLVKLSPEPFEERNPVHVQSLCAAYEAFPAVARRIP